jgi:hypothetical protein
MSNQATLFDGTYLPQVSTVDGYEGDDSGKRLTLWQKVTRRLYRAKSLAVAISSLNPDVIIANDPDSCGEL